MSYTVSKIIFVIVVKTSSDNNIELSGEKPSLEEMKECTTTEDCGCGPDIYTQECMPANKKYIDSYSIILDECVGICHGGGINHVKCLGGECNMVANVTPEIP